MSVNTSKTLRQTAYERIKQGIVNGEWEGGTFLSEQWLCGLLKMSKTPIRSAFDRLEMMGLVNHSHNQGVYVQEVSIKKIMEIYELRLSLETFAAKALTGKLDQVIFDKLDRNLILQDQAVHNDDIISYVELDRHFHEIIITGLDNEEYSEAISRIQDKFLMAVRTTFKKNKKRLWSSIEEHRQIRNALAGNDPAITVALVTKHIEFVKKIML